MKLIFRAPVVKVEDIVIDVYDPLFTRRVLVVFLGEIRLSETELETLAQHDGFADAAEMGEFWHQEHGLGRFEGQLIHWDFNQRKDK